MSRQSVQPHPFWVRWLLAVTGFLLVFSLCFVFFPALMQQFFNLLFFQSAQPPASFSADAIRYITLTYGVLGAVMVGWSISLGFIFQGPFREGVRGAWVAAVASISVWFVLDTSFSLSAGFWQNAVFNVLFAACFAVPLLATRPAALRRQ